MNEISCVVESSGLTLFCQQSNTMIVLNTAAVIQTTMINNVCFTGLSITMIFKDLS